ncbi:hypothetical protein PULV_b0767 [Pseudoalteromonas ulvae UL12]|nr:hypothetical protein [Pseudoalteromonas ulvae UL12]
MRFHSDNSEPFITETGFLSLDGIILGTFATKNKERVWEKNSKKTIRQTGGQLR